MEMSEESSAPNLETVTNTANSEPLTANSSQVPIRVSTNLMNFFNQANLGLSDPLNPKSKPLNRALPLLTDHGITSPSILTTLFAIYATINNLTLRASCNRVDPFNPESALLPPAQRRDQYLGVDALMRHWLSETFDRFRARGTRQTPKGKEIPSFDPENFTYPQFQGIISLNQRTRESFGLRSSKDSQDGKVHHNTQTAPDPDDSEKPNPAGPSLSDAEYEALIDPDVKRALQYEWAQVKKTFDCLKQLGIWR